MTRQSLSATWIGVTASLVLTACSEPERAPAPGAGLEPGAPARSESATDYHSFANTDDYRVTHLGLDIDVASLRSDQFYATGENDFPSE